MALTEGGALEEEAMEHTIRALSAMKLEAESRGAENIPLLATSATRDAANAEEFRQRIRERTGLELQVIPGEVEAQLAFTAASGMEDCVVMDIGGGSTEYSRGNAGVVQFARSTQMGASRLLKMTDITCQRDADRAVEIARDTLKNAAEALLALPKAEKMVGIGGTCTTAVSILQGYLLNPDDVEGVELTQENVREQLDMLAGMSLEERMQVPGLPETRIKHMPHGLCILLASMQLLGYDRIRVSAKTILDGYLLKKGMGETV